MRIPLVLLAALLGCSSSISPGDAGSELDGGTMRDVGGADAAADVAPADAGQDAAADVGVDVAVDVGNDSGALSSCVVEYFMSQGDGCFCMGPIATFGQYVYRQSLGIEVFDAQDPENLVRLANVDERPSANGRLAVRGALLVSTLDFEEAPIRLYSLADPAVPTEITRFGAISVRGFAAGDSDIAVIEEPLEGTTELVHYEVSDEGARETWRYPLPDVPRFPDASLAILGDDVFLATLEGRDPEVTRVRRFDASGVETLNVMRSGYVRLFASSGELYETGGEARVARLNLVTLDTETSFGESAFGETVLVRGDIVVLNGTTVLERTTLRELPVFVVGGDGARGFDAMEAGEGDMVFGSNGNGLIPFSLRCE